MGHLGFIGGTKWNSSVQDGSTNLTNLSFYFRYGYQSLINQSKQRLSFNLIYKKINKCNNQFNLRLINLGECSQVPLPKPSVSRIECMKMNKSD